MATLVEESDDLLEEILIRIPTHILVKFKPVSKRWYNLVSSSKFAMRHSTLLHLRSSSKTILLSTCRGQGGRALTTLLSNGCTPPVRNNISKLREIDLLDDVIWSFHARLLLSGEDPDSNSFTVLHASNGLFLFSLHTVNSEKMYYLVSNPLTKEYAELPPLVATRGTYSSQRTRLNFDPTKSSHYKVVIINFNNGGSTTGGAYQIHVYSSEERTWKLSEIFTGWMFHRSIVVNNSVLCCPSRRAESEGYTTIFDLESLCLTSLQPLPPSFGNVRYHYFGESGGYLYLVQGPVNNFSEIPKNYTLWEMMGAQGSWMYKLRFTLGGRIEILHIHRNHEQRFQMFLGKDTPSPAVYCIKINTVSNSIPTMEYVCDCNSDILNSGLSTASR